MSTRIYIRLPERTKQLWQAQADEDGQELAEWVRDCCNANLSRERQGQNVETRRRGRPSQNERLSSGSTR